MVLGQIMTLCEVCQKELTDALFRVKPVPPIVLATEKKDRCEYCGRKFSPAELKQYTVTGR